ncbi:flagellar basal body rod protein FlgB [Pelagibacterium xiamenense]|uniref:flagellar basal body rod protein FlgB n=1 Tax=Pelagibacterium xiamenense TaxID=2901140 RepID=UPI001E5EF108|nr:flagellar basal body rod protein FlgB [Pelagibacterium xiamenense]MCD7059995.1 flagellar basal body rod protein FlgB [Pelagibacterium xiamenense]
MAMGDLPIFAALKDRMQWHQTRQTLLAENVANAETPGYRGRDLAPYTFDQELEGSRVSVAARATDPRHFSVGGSRADAYGARQLNNFEIMPEGNGVTLEEEMMKVTTNQMDYQAATTIYTRSMRLLRIALGKQA